MVRGCQANRSSLVSAAQIIFLASWTARAEPANGPGYAYNSPSPPAIAAVLTGSPPIIDGILNEAAWQQTTANTQLQQYLPRQNCDASHPTEVRVLFDKNNLYIGLSCRDNAPVTARSMNRDGDIESDDYVAILLETFRNRRQGYLFMVNPNGARKDALIGESLTLNYDWNGQWTARCRRDTQGWTAEIAIPFKTLSFDPAAATWGINIERRIARTSEYARWRGARPEVPLQDLSVCGDITGLSGLSQGYGIEITPYALARLQTQKTEPRTSTTSDIGGDVRYRITPNVSAAASFNTDFAETEIDDRVINFTRFPVFFPEKRAYFLEDSDIFAFNGHKNILPFYSRRIGLSAMGDTVPILATAKLTGRIGDCGFGVLGTTLDSQDDVGSQDLFVARVVQGLLEQSSLGFIGTDGNPNANQDNHLVGSDFHYRTSEFLGDRILESKVFGLMTSSETTSNTVGYAYGCSLLYPNDLLNASINGYEISDDFDPALGFVARKGVRGATSSWEWGPRPQTIPKVRQFLFLYFNEYFTDLDNNLQSSLHGVRPIAVVFESADTFYMECRHVVDVPRESFDIADNVTLPEGQYAWNTAEAGVEFAKKRMVGGSLRATAGEFYDGERQEYAAGIDFRPCRRLGFQANYSYNRVDLPEGSFDTHLADGRIQLNITPDCAWANLIQYDSLSDSIGVNSRFHWEFAPGRKLSFVVGVNSGNGETSPFTPVSSETIVKLTMAFRL